MAGVKTQSASLNGNTAIAELIARGAKIDFGTYAFDSEYATGGEAITFPSMGTIVVQGAFNKGGYSFEIASSKIKAMVSGGSSTVQVEVAGSTDLSALSDVMYFAIGW